MSEVKEDELTLISASEDDLLHELYTLECPFTWNIPPIPPDQSENARCRAERRAAQDRFERGRIEEIAVVLTLCYEYGISGDLEKAFEALQDWQLSDLELNLKMKLDNKGSEFEISEEIARSEAYNHVHSACKCFLLFKSRRFREAKEALISITPFKTLHKDGQALVYWLQSDMLKDYFHSGIKEGIFCVEKALQLFPYSPTLLYQLGRLLALLRRMVKVTFPDFQEIPYLEAALQETGHPEIMVMLARSYKDKGINLKWKSSRDNQEIKATFQKSADMYRKVLLLPERSVSLIVRCAEGLLKLPPPWRDLDKAKELLDEALELRADDVTINHIAGMYYTTTGDLERAKHYLMLSTDGMTRNYGACMGLIGVRQKENYEYNPIPDLEKMVDYFKHQPVVENIFCYLGCYYYQENNFERALEYWTQMMERNVHSEKLKEFYWEKYHKVMNINKIIIQEINKKIHNGTCSEEEKCIREKLLAANPDLGLEHSGGTHFEKESQSFHEQKTGRGGSRTEERVKRKDSSWRRGPAEDQLPQRHQENERCTWRRPPSTEDGARSISCKPNIAPALLPKLLWRINAETSSREKGRRGK